MEERDTARLIVLDPQDRVLLMRLDPAPGSADDGLWVTLGGRIEPGESVLEAAARELWEETGIVDAQVGPVVWYGEQVLEVAGELRSLRESFVLARCTTTALTDSGWTAEERQAIAEMRWWSLAELNTTTKTELDTTTKTVKPPRLAEHLHALIEAGSTEAQDLHTPRSIDLQ